jgi:hypothetical protein
MITEKNGCDVVEVSTLVKHIIDNCPNLKFMGLMTIGMFGYNIANGPNPDFIRLIGCREKICKELNIDIKNIELSMGMSNDYEHAVSSLGIIQLDKIVNIYIFLHDIYFYIYFFID